MDEITKIDGKGRLLMPSEMRKALGIDTGMQVLLSCEPGEKKAMLTPIMDKTVYDLKIKMGDRHGSLAKIADFLAKQGFDIIMSESRSLEREKSAEWSLTGKYEGDFSKLAEKLNKLDFVVSVDTKRR